MLTVAQLTGLLFQPTLGVFGQTSALTYRVTDPSGLSTSGSVALAIAADTSPPVVIDLTLMVAPNSGATPIGIPAPTDPYFAAPQLSITVTGLPSDGAVLLSDGITAIAAGQTLTV